MTRLGFTGTMKGLTQEQRRRALEIIRDADLLLHGDCMGADADADGLAHEADVSVHIYPPDDPKARAFCGSFAAIADEAPYLDRNRRIVERSDRLLACPGQHHEVVRSGTWATIRYAAKVGTPVQIIYPDGTEATR